MSVPLKAQIWDRDPLDWYVEPPGVTTALLSVESFTGAVLDPACGAGNIVEACRAAGLEGQGTDIKRRTDRPWFVGECDFLDPAYPWRAPNIVTNPPFYRARGTESFIRLSLQRGARKLAVFADVKFLAGSGRANGLFATHRPSRVWIISPRPSCPPGEWLRAGNVAGGGTADWCWIVWDSGSPPALTELRWLSTRGAEGAGEARA